MGPTGTPTPHLACLHGVCLPPSWSLMQCIRPPLPPQFLRPSEIDLKPLPPSPTDKIDHPSSSLSVIMLPRRFHPHPSPPAAGAAASPERGISTSPSTGSPLLASLFSALRPRGCGIEGSCWVSWSGRLYC